MAVVEGYSRFYIGSSAEGSLTFSLEIARSVTYRWVQVYTNLFPARHTWYLLGTIIILNGIDWAAFEILSIGNKEILSLPSGYRVLDGLFQALGSWNFQLQARTRVHWLIKIQLSAPVASMLSPSPIYDRVYLSFMVSRCVSFSLLYQGSR